jgi:hypothetical protein
MYRQRILGINPPPRQAPKVYRIQTETDYGGSRFPMQIVFTLRQKIRPVKGFPKNRGKKVG